MATPGKGAGSSKAGTKALEKHLHTINIEELIVHRYADHEALFKKSDKLAREIIEGELREGEGMRPLRAGVYQVFFPKLTPEAGALRCSVIAERVAREIRQLNPTSSAIDREKEEMPHQGPRRISGAPHVPAEGMTPDGHHEAATRAMAMMAEAASTEEISITEGDKAILGSLKMTFQPVWHIKNNIITGYFCSLTRDGKAVSPHGAELFPGNSADVAAAKLDAAIYKNAAEAIRYLLKHGLKALLIVPMHFSTVDRLRFMGPLLESGRDLPDEAKSLLVFELNQLPRDLTRFRLREPVSYLRTRARALLARTGFEPADLDIFKEFGFHGVGVDLADYEWKEARLLKGFERFVEDAETYKLQSFVHGISSKSMVVAAMAAGVRYMDGPAVSDPIESPKHIQPYELDMLYQE